jgi:AcrR family transcriptional regulator
VTSPKPGATTPRRGGYHHGSLRRALLDAAHSLVARNGPEGFTLRAAAREAGVTAGAPYHHFPDKDALISALAEEGFGLLCTALERAAAEHEEHGARAHEMAVAYVRFAAEHPTHFRLMMGRDARRARPDAKRSPAAERAYTLTRSAVVAQWTGDPLGSLPEEIVLGSWSIVHGLSFLAIDGHLGGEGATWEDQEPLVRKTLRAAAPPRPLRT